MSTPPAVSPSPPYPSRGVLLRGLKDESLVFFLANLHQLKPIKLLIMALGVAGAYWFGQGR